MYVCVLMCVVMLCCFCVCCDVVCACVVLLLCVCFVSFLCYVRVAVVLIGVFVDVVPPMFFSVHVVLLCDSVVCLIVCVLDYSSM